MTARKDWHPKSRILKLIDKRIKELRDAQRIFIINNNEQNPIIESKITELEELKSKIQGKC